MYKLSHENIVRVFNYYLYPEIFTGYIIMEYIDGMNIEEYIQNICKQIQENVAESTSLSTFASKLGYSTTYLGKIFHKLTGVSFSQYLLNARINQAKLLLRTSNLSISAIAEQLGYYDTSHFIKQFKQIVGRSPNVYR